MPRRRRFKLTAITFRSILMDWHRSYRVVLSVVVIGSPVGLIIYGELTNMPSGVRAPTICDYRGYGIGRNRQCSR